MCGRFYNCTDTVHGWRDILGNWPAEYETGFNVAPTQQVPVVICDDIKNSVKERNTLAARWGLIPSWSKTFDSKYSTFNARIESVEKSPAFRGAWKHSHTCLVPVGGYYEWVNTAGKKQPYLLHKPGDLLVFAGLWEPWQDQFSFTILTEDARGDLQRIHKRMPVMLDPTQAHEWLTLGTANPNSIFCSTVFNTVQYYPVSTRVNNVRNQGPTLIEAIADA